MNILATKYEVTRFSNRRLRVCMCARALSSMLTQKTHPDKIEAIAPLVLVS